MRHRKVREGEDAFASSPRDESVRLADTRDACATLPNLRITFGETIISSGFETRR
jgi:hypothetical protein